MSKRRCPTPRKMAYPTRELAQRHVSSLYSKEGRTAMVRPYKCVCGAWHVGGRRKKIGRRP